MIKWWFFIMEQDKIKDSPFYVEYTGKIDDHWSITTTESFKKALAKHLKDKYPNEKNKQGKHNFSKCVRLILENYLYLQCTSRKTYDYNIVSIIGDKQFDNGEIMIYDVIKDKSNKEHILTGHSRQLYWANVNEKALNERYDLSDLTEIGKLIDVYKNKFDCDGVLVVDLPLNNFFDEYVDGIYTFDAENKPLHCGVNIISRTNGVFCVVYIWYLNQYYKPTIHSIKFEDVEQTMNDLADVNVNAFRNFEKSLNVLEDKIPKDEVERLIKQNESYEKQNESLMDIIKLNQEKIDSNKSRLDELTK